MKRLICVALLAWCGVASAQPDVGCCGGSSGTVTLGNGTAGVSHGYCTTTLLTCPPNNPHCNATTCYKADGTPLQMQFFPVTLDPPWICQRPRNGKLICQGTPEEIADALRRSGYRQ